MFESLLAWLAGRVLRIRRRHVENALARASLPDPAALADQMYTSLARGIAELLRASRGERLDVALSAPLASLLFAARTNGRGLVLCAAHLGNWELAAGRLAREIELFAVVKRQSIGAADRFMTRLRTALGLKLTYPDDALAASRAAVARGAAVFMMIDQRPTVPAREPIVTEFLGAPVEVERSPAALALRAGVPLLVLGFRRTRGASPELSIELLGRFDPPPRAERNARTWIPDTMRAATARLADFIREKPADWMWLHRRWPADVPRKP